MQLSMVILPPLICTALLTINGSLGSSIAILGVFGLVRFRSLPGTSTDIVCIFYAMVIGLLFSTGLYAMAFVISALIGALLIVVSMFIKPSANGMEVRINAPETLQDLSVFTTTLKKHGKQVRLIRVRSAAMGTLYELTYHFLPSKGEQIPEMMEQIRLANGNMNVLCGDLMQEEGTL